MNVLRRLVAAVLLVACITIAQGGIVYAAPEVHRERIDIPSMDEPHTPAQFNRVRAFRYFATGAPEPATVLVLLPGVNSGPNTMDILARALIGASARPLEVWVVEPRATLLQDRRGIRAAIARRNPDVALAYYYGKYPVDGYVFTPRRREDTAFAAYWGLDLHLRDIRAAVTEVHRRHPDSPVFLGGHSLGAILAALYAGYDFDRIPGPWPIHAVNGIPAPSDGAGFRDLRGLVMLDGVPLAIVPRLSENQYLQGFFLPGLPRFPGVEQLTASDSRHRVGAFTDTSNVARVEDSILFDVIVVYAYLKPDEASTLPFSPRRGLAITNEALLGAVLSNEMQPDLFVRASIGSPLGVFNRVRDPININPGGLLDLRTGRPAPGERLIRWIPYDRSTPRGRVDLRALEEAILRPGGDFTQWYMPWRLVLDLGLASSLDTSDTFARQYLSLTQMPHMRLPTLIIGAGNGLIRRIDETQFFVDHIATPPASVRRAILPGYTHLDIENAVDNLAVPQILDWLESMVH